MESYKPVEAERETMRVFELLNRLRGFVNGGIMKVCLLTKTIKIQASVVLEILIFVFNIYLTCIFQNFIGLVCRNYGLSNLLLF